jgi:hypothetical protein
VVRVNKCFFVVVTCFEVLVISLEGLRIGQNSVPLGYVFYPETD